MTARAEVEDMLDEAAWRERIGLERPTALERGAYMPAAEVLAASEKQYRNEPLADAYDELPVIPLGWVLVIAALATVALILGLCNLLSF